MSKSEIEYKIQQLEKMLEYESKQPYNKQYGAHLTHWSGTAKAINIDQYAIMALIAHYKALEALEN